MAERENINSSSVIDSHQHFWIYNPLRDTWITDEMKIIQRNFLPEDLAPLYKQNNVVGCVAVQADQSETETEFLLSLANEYDFILGVVGWVDLRSDSLEERLQHFGSFKKLKGFRHIAQAEPKGFLTSQKFERGIRSLTAHNFTYDILIYPHQMQDAIELVGRHPQQKFVIDHLAKPNIREKEFDYWASQIKNLAAHPNVYCKLSGMTTEAKKEWAKEDFRPYLDFVLNQFGTSRVMYGSDWPVCLVAATYPDQLNIIKDYFQTFSKSEKHKIMNENAIRFYNL
jgi:L-fuconolactonase